MGRAGGKIVDEVTFDVNSSWEYFKGWLNRYAVTHSPSEVSNLRFVSRQTHALMTGMRFKAIIEGAYQGNVVLPLFEFSVMVFTAKCAVTARCNEQDLAGYFGGLLLAIAEQWPETKRENERAVNRLPQATSAASVAAVTPEKTTTPNAKDKGIKPEIERRAELAKDEKAKDASLSYQGAATRLMRLREQARKTNQNLGIGDKEPITGDDINYAVGRMRAIPVGNGHKVNRHITQDDLPW